MTGQLDKANEIAALAATVTVEEILAGVETTQDLTEMPRLLPMRYPNHLDAHEPESSLLPVSNLPTGALFIAQ
jgi:hypothetical protein